MNHALSAEGAYQLIIYVSIPPGKQAYQLMPHVPDPPNFYSCLLNALFRAIGVPYEIISHHSHVLMLQVMAMVQKQTWVIIKID
jgi:hypothetical protein